MADDYDDSAAYSDDHRYLWWWERRWADGPSLCWVGLNPSTADTTGRPRPTLRKVVALAKAQNLGAVTVVNPLSWRATKPADLKRAAIDHDIAGERTDDVIVEVSGRSPITLAAWGSHGSLLGRGVAVADLVRRPLCLGVTASGQPRHPLYVPTGTELRPYRPPGSTASEKPEHARYQPRLLTPVERALSTAGRLVLADDGLWDAAPGGHRHFRTGSIAGAVPHPQINHGEELQLRPLASTAAARH